MCIVRNLFTFFNIADHGIGLDTHLGKQYEDGVEVSGGQSQKIAIARDFLEDDNAGLAILDEPTAAIGPKSEYAIYQSFAELNVHKTVILVTHRLSSVTMADKVIFMQDGQIQGFDTHKRLMANNPRLDTLKCIECRQRRMSKASKRTKL